MSRLHILSKDINREVEDPICWRRFTEPPAIIPETDWMPDRHLQNPALFLQEEAEMAGEEIGYEVEDNDVPGAYFEKNTKDY